MPDDDQSLRPVCFMIMPFRRKKIDEPKGPDAPPELDCDALWDKAFRPAIDALGYLPIRADYDPGSVIVKDMLERLALAELVLADVSLPNENVYYEVGLRHVAKETSCVLLAADWSRQLFDIDQFTSIRYALRGRQRQDPRTASASRLPPDCRSLHVVIVICVPLCRCRPVLQVPLRILTGRGFSTRCATCGRLPARRSCVRR